MKALTKAQSAGLLKVTAKRETARYLGVREGTLRALADRGLILCEIVRPANPAFRPYSVFWRDGAQHR